MSKKIADATIKLVSLLEPLEQSERRKAIDAALVILGDTPRNEQAAATSSGAAEGTITGSRAEKDGWPAHTKLRTWMKQHNVTHEQLEQLYDVENGKVNVIASSVAGKKSGEKARNAYLLQGIAGLIELGEPTFSDEAARQLCVHLGCYDQNNHSIYLRPLGNQVTGSKKSGWKLTSPGLAGAATVIKGMSAEGKA